MNDLINKFSREVSSLYKEKIKKLILFGSYARGEERTDSDIDILIVWDGLRSEGIDKVEDIAYDYLLEYGIYFSIKVISIDQYKILKEKHSPFFKNIEKEGVLLV